MCDKCSNPPVEMDYQTIDAMRQMHGHVVRMHTHRYAKDVQTERVSDGVSEKTCCGRKMLHGKSRSSWACDVCDIRNAVNSKWTYYTYCFICGGYEERRDPSEWVLEPEVVVPILMFVVGIILVACKWAFF